MDVIALHAAGFEFAVATLGTAITSEQARIFAKYTKKVLIFCVYVKINYTIANCSCFFSKIVLLCIYKNTLSFFVFKNISGGEIHEKI